MKTHALGIIPYENIVNVVNNSIRIAIVTHTDPRSVASAVGISVLISLMLNGYKDIDQILDLTFEITQNSMLDYLDILESEIMTLDADLIAICNQNKDKILAISHPDILKRYMNSNISDLLPLDQQGD